MKAKFKTHLPFEIKDADDAKKLLKELYVNGESYHPEDDAFDCLSHTGLTKANGEHLNMLMGQIYALPGNENCQKMVFDPCEYLLALDASEDLKNFYYFDNIAIGAFVHLKKMLIMSGHKLKDVFCPDFKSSVINGERMTIYFTSKIGGFDFAGSINEFNFQNRIS